MFLGPVFNAELLTTARRRRYYISRLVYGLTLLALVGWAYESKRHLSDASGVAGTKFNFLAETAEAIFATFITTQVVAVLALTPAMVAGTIADEKQRKTLHYLLASQLTSLEIVGGKLAARLLQLVVLVMVGLPIMSMISLFGGLDPPLILAAFLGTVTTAFCLASLSILVSTVSKRARDAIITVYVLEVLWLAGPTIVSAILGGSTTTLAFLGRVFEPILRIDPFQLARLSNPTPDLPGKLAWMAGLQTALGLGFVGLAVWRLRKSAAGADRGRSAIQHDSTGLLPRLLRRPRIGADPMLWKEMHVARVGMAMRVFGMLVAVFAVVFLGDALLDLGRPAFAELKKFGYGDGPSLGNGHRGRDSLNEFIRLTAAGTAFFWLLGIAGTVAAGVSSEREDDTWISLLGTSLTGWEILRAKALGALWRWRIAGILVLTLWTFGLVAGAIHPLAYALSLALFTAYTAFSIAIGSAFSMRARSTTRAMLATVGVLFVLNGGYLMCLFPLRSEFEGVWHAPVTWLVLHTSAAKYSAVQLLFGTYPQSVNLQYNTVWIQLATCLTSLVGYSVVAAVLGVLTVDSFDRIADRPRRPAGFSAALTVSIDQEADDPSEPESVLTAPALPEP
jgi:ABC-type transport system involved in multi-copper enzyme maturation permease subunit